MDQRILFIVGTGRSGTKLLRKMLNMHPEVRLVKETTFLPVLYEKFQLNKITFEDYFGVVEQHYGSNGEKWISLLARDAGQNPLTVKSDLKRYCNLESGHIGEFTELLYEFLYGKRFILGDKTPHYGLTMATLKKIWPQAKFIHTIRDGVFASRSMMTHPGFNRWINGGLSIPEIIRSHYQGRILDFEYKPVSLDQCKALWRELVSETLRQKELIPADDYLEIKYEEIVYDPVTILLDISKFLGVKGHPDWLLKAAIVPKPFYLRQVKSRLSKAEYLESAQDISALMKDLGYFPLGKKYYRGRFVFGETFRSLGHLVLNSSLSYIAKDLLKLSSGVLSDFKLLLKTLARFLRPGRMPQRFVFKLDGRFEGTKVTFNDDTRSAVVVKAPSQVEFRFQRPVKADRLQFAMSFQNIGWRLNLQEHSLLLAMEVETGAGVQSFDKKLPIAGALDKDWSNGVCAYLNKYWGDHTLDLGGTQTVSKLSLRIELCDLKGRLLNEVKARTVRPQITIPDPRPAARPSTERRAIVALCFESWVDPFYLVKQYGTDPLFEKYSDILSGFHRYAGGISQSDWTFPCASSNIYGLYALQHGFTNPAILKSKKKYTYRGSSLASIAKANGFKTFAGVFSTKYGPNLGLSKGFDSYEHNNQAVALLNPLPPTSNAIVRNLEKFDQDDCFIFVHTDLLHAPHYAVSQAMSRNTPPIFPDLEDGRLRNPDEHYLRNLRLVYFQFFNLMDYLQVSGQFDNTMLVLFGDHGFDLQNWHEHKSEYPLRESRIRVPYAIHWPKWSKYHHLNGVKEESFREANIGVVKDICKALDEPLPEPVRMISERYPELKDCCVSESIDHPEVGDYFLSIRGKEDKYVLRTKIDWENYEMDSKFDQYLFPISEEKLILDSDLTPEGARAAYYQSLAKGYINENLKFRKEIGPDLISKD